MKCNIHTYLHVIIVDNFITIIALQLYYIAVTHKGLQSHFVTGVTCQLLKLKHFVLLVMCSG